MSLYIGNKKVTPIKVSGSETIRLQNKDITDNGVYTADEGYTGLGTVNVQVPKGTTPSGNIDITENGSYDVANYATASVNVSGGGDFIGIPREVTSDGVFQSHSSDNLFTFTLPSNVKNIGRYGLYYAFAYNKGLISADLSGVETLSVTACMEHAFYSCSNLQHVDLRNLKSIKPTDGGAHMDCMYGAFQNCTNLQTIDLSNLNDIDCKWAFRAAFAGCSNLKTLSFPSLNTNSFHLYTDVFSQMLLQVTGCTVHFPSNLQSVIGSWSDVASGFGGTNTTVLFDLPATT